MNPICPQGPEGIQELCTADKKMKEFESKMHTYKVGNEIYV